MVLPRRSRRADGEPDRLQTMEAGCSATRIRVGCQWRRQDIDTRVVRVQLQLRQCAMARGHGWLRSVGQPDEPAERTAGRSMARFSGRHSISARQRIRCAVLGILEYAEHVFQCEDAGNVIVEPQPPKTNWIGLAFFGDLHRKRDDASVDSEANQSGGVHSRQLDNRQYESTPALQPRASGGWTIDGVYIRDRLRRDAEL